MGQAKPKIEEGSPEARELLLRALLRVGDQWELSPSILASILRKNRSRLTQWQQNGGLPENLQPATKETLQHLLAIYRSLGAIFQSPSDQVKWLKADHPDLGGKPLAMMQQSIQGLIEVRTYLDYIRGRGA